MAAPTNGHLEFRLLGSIEVRREDELVAVGGPRQRRLLAALALRANHVVSIDDLIDVVFDGAPTANGEHALHTYISRLRSALGKASGAQVVTKPPGYMLDADSSSVDTLSFEELVGRADRAFDAGDPARALALADDALALWHGRALAEFAYEDWAQPDVKRLEELRTLARERRIAARLALGAAAEVVPEIDQLVADQQLRDAPTALLMTALYRAGREADALRAYQQYRAHLADEAGLEPGAPLRLLERQILEQDPALRAPRPAGRELRGYRLVEQIGTGTFSTVHRAVQTSVGREVAIKIIRSELADNPTFIRLFDREAQLVARLEHPHIVPLHDYWREPGGAYLVMRLMRGGSAEDRLVENGAFTLAETGRMVDEIGEALAVAHAQGVVHRDVKPANVLYDENGHAYLSDFGIAVEESGRKPGDTALRAAASPLYAAPEQLRDFNATPASDQYAFANVVWELVAGTSPFDVSSVAELLIEKSRGSLPPLADLRPDLPPALDLVIRRATAPDPAARFPDMGEFVLAFRAANAVAAGVRTTGDPVLSDERPRARDSRTLVSVRIEQQNPYKGLRAFHEADAVDFFGRTRLTADLLARVTAQRLVAVVGPSGVGKSSVVRAGLVPAIRQGSETREWFIATMTPGRDPYAELEIALLRLSTGTTSALRSVLGDGASGIGRAVRLVLPDDVSELLLVVDQFEELFTLCADEELRSVFLAALVDAVSDTGSRLRVVLTLRADAYDRPLQYRAFAELVEAGLVTVMTPSGDELAEAITRPAERVGVTVEPGLMAQLIADVSDRPSALPLLQYALTELYEQRAGGRMTLDSYQAVGGVSGALANRADAVFEELPAEMQGLAQHVFTSLLVVDERAVEPRRRVAVAEITMGADDWRACEEVIRRFAEQRLLSYDRDPQTRNPTVEIAHEALLRCWPRLAQWVDEDRDNLRMVQTLSAAATSWDNAGRDEADLLRGPRLAAASGWAEDHPARLVPVQREFLEAAQLRHDRELRAARRTTKRVRRIAIGLAVALALSIAAVVVAMQQRQQAGDARAAAQRQGDVATALYLAARSADLTLWYPALSLALASEAVGATQTPVAPAISALLEGRTALRSAPLTPTALPVAGHTGWINNVQFSPDGTRLASAGADQNVRLWDPESGSPIGEPLVGHSRFVTEVAFSPDGRLLASSSLDHDVRLWDAHSGESLGAPLSGHDAGVQGVAFSPDGSLLASASDDGTVNLWDPGSHELVDTFVVANIGGLRDVAFSPDGKHLATAQSNGAVRVWDMATKQPLAALTAGFEPFNIQFSPDGAVLAASGSALAAWDTATWTLIARPPEAVDEAVNVAFNPKSTVLATPGRDGVLLWDAHTLQPAGHIRMITSFSAAFSPDGTRLAIGREDGTVAFLGNSGATPVPTLATELDLVQAIRFFPDGDRLATAGTNGTVLVWDLDSHAVQRELRGAPTSVYDIDVAPDAKRLVAAGADGTVTFWDLLTGERIGEQRPAHQGIVHAVSFSPDGRLVVSAGADGMLRLWNPSTGDPRPEAFDAHTSTLFDVEFSPDGKIVAVADRSGVVRIWDPVTLEEVHEPLGATQDDDGVFTVAFSADGRTLFSAGLDGVVRRWDVATWQEASGPLMSHQGPVFALATDRLGRFVVSGGSDGLTVWDARTRQILAQFNPDETPTSSGGAVLALDFRPDGRTVAIGGNGGLVRLWDDLDPSAACDLIAEMVKESEVREYLPEARDPHVCQYSVGE